MKRVKKTAKEGSEKRGQTRTVTSVAQVGPDDVFLREAEDSEPASSHGRVNHNFRVRHHVRPLKQLHPGNTRL